MLWKVSRPSTSTRVPPRPQLTRSLVGLFPGSAIEALPLMLGIISSRPSTFRSVEEAIDWQFVLLFRHFCTLASRLLLRRRPDSSLLCPSLLPLSPPVSLPQPSSIQLQHVSPSLPSFVLSLLRQPASPGRPISKRLNRSGRDGTAGFRKSSWESELLGCWCWLEPIGSTRS